MWKSKKLSEIADINYGKGLPKNEFKETGYPVFGANGVIGYYDKFHYEDEMVLISCRGAASGTINISPPKSFITNNSLILKFDESKYSKKFMYFALKEVNKSEIISGSAQPQVTIRNATDLKISFPSLPEQYRVVDKIEELFSELDHGEENLEKAQMQLKTYRQAVLKDAFEGKLTKEWREQQDDLPTPEKLLQQIKAERKAHRERELNEWEKEVEQWVKEGEPGRKPRKPRKGNTLPPLESDVLKELPELPSFWDWSRFYNVTFNIGDVNHKMPKDAAKGLPYLSTGDINTDGTLDFSNAKIISEEDFYELAKKIKPERGDIIFPRYGTIGRNVLVNTDREFLVSYSCAVIKNITNVMNEKFIYYYTLSPMIKKEIEKYTVETTQANIGLTSIGSFVIPICSREEQNKVIKEIESRLSVVDQLEQTIKENLQKAEALRQSILKKAFCGELVE